MADYSDEITKGQKQKATHKQKLRRNNSAVEFIMDPPGSALEPTDDRRRQGQQRIAFRTKRRPNIDSFITIPMMTPDAKWTGTIRTDFTKATFDSRLDWELNAPRFLVQPPKPGQSLTEGEFVMPLGMIDFWYDKLMDGKVDLV